MVRAIDISGLPKQTQEAIERVLHPSDLKTQILLSDVPEDKKKAIIKVIDNGNAENIQVIRQFLRKRKNEKHG
jgi:predicted nucleotidyltransferase